MSAREIIAKWLRVMTTTQTSLSDAENLIAALRSAGFAVVPVEPTEGMIREGFHTASGVRDIYQAMISAAQEDSRERVATY